MAGEGESFKIEHFGQQIENELFWNGLDGGWEKTSIRLWKELCRDAKVILDIGANTGLYSLVSKTVSPDSQVYAFEPVERVFDKLKKNIILNKFNIQAERLALSNYNGTATIYDIPGEHILSVTVNKNLHNPATQVQPVKIQVAEFFTYFNENKIQGCDLIKIDVETHEPEVLEGMRELLYIFKPVILIEVLSDEIGEQIQKIVSPNNYLYFDIDEEWEIKHVLKIKKSSHFNYLLCSDTVARKLELVK